MQPICRIVAICAVLSLLLCTGLEAAGQSFIGPMHTIKAHASTIPPNGDVNPYGVAVVPATIGRLIQGSILVSNFNNAANLQGTGTTIVQVSPGTGTAKLFAHIDPTQLPGSCPGGVGLTTALSVLSSGWVIVGSLPTTDGTAATAQAGCLIVLNNLGSVVETFSGGDINGPWDMTAFDTGTTAVLFLTNVLNGTVAAGGQTVNGGTILRLHLTISGSSMPAITSSAIIGSGFPERTDPAALVIGPTGLGLSADGTLYVADTQNSLIAAIPDALTRTTDAGTGSTVSAGGALNSPLGLAIAPNGDIIIVNGGDGNMVETTPAGSQVAVKAVDVTETGAGTLFGLAIRVDQPGVYFVNDGNNTLDLLH